MAENYTNGPRLIKPEDNMYVVLDKNNTVLEMGKAPMQKNYENSV